MVVAGVALGAELAQLLGAHAAAAAAVEHQGDAGGAGGARSRSALALPAALLALSLLQVPRGTQRERGGVRAAAGTARMGQARRAAGGSTYRAEEGEQQGYGPRDQGAGDHPAAVSGLWVARRRRRAGSGVGLPGGEGNRGEPRASRRADLLGGADGAAAGAVPEGGCCTAPLSSAPLRPSTAAEWLCDCRVPARTPLYRRRRRGLANGLNGAADKQRHSAHSCAPRRAARPAPRRRRRPGAALTPDSRIPPAAPPQRTLSPPQHGFLFFVPMCLNVSPRRSRPAPGPGSALFRGGRRVRREGARGAAGRLPGAFGGIRYFPSPVLPARPSSLPRAQGTRCGWIGGGAGYPVSGGERSRRFGTTEKRYNYTTGYKLTLCTTESY